MKYNFAYTKDEARRAVARPTHRARLVASLAECWTPCTSRAEFFRTIALYQGLTGEVACQIFHEVLDFVENIPVDPTKDPRVINVGFYDADGVYFTTWEARRGYTENLGCANTWSFAPTHVQYWCGDRVKEVRYEDFPDVME